MQQSMNRIVYGEDLAATSGNFVAVLFSAKNPDGMRLKDMLESDEGWIQRAARRFIGEGGTT